MSQASRIARLIPGVAIIVMSTLVLAGTARAGVLVESAASCDDQVTSQPFLPWADPANYVLAPQGDFEAGSGEWTTTGSTQVLSRNETFYVGGAGHDASLELDAGSSATSRAMCVGLEHPTIRFFAQRTSGSILSSLRVEALFEDNLGLIQSLPIGLVLGGSNWAPTLPYAVIANLLPLLPGDHTPVAFRFTPQGSGTWVIDDVYVDPYQGR